MSLWVYEGPFSKILIFPTDFNDFIKVSDHFGAALGSFRVTLEPLLAYEGDFWAYLKHL